MQTFKALITVHKILQEGHPIVRCPFADGAFSVAGLSTDARLNIPRQTLKEAQNQTSWLETCARTMGNDSARGTYRIPLTLSSRRYP